MTSSEIAAALTALERVSAADLLAHKSRFSALAQRIKTKASATAFDEGRAKKAREQELVGQAAAALALLGPLAAEGSRIGGWIARALSASEACRTRECCVALSLAGSRVGLEVAAHRKIFYRIRRAPARDIVSLCEEYARCDDALRWILRRVARCREIHDYEYGLPISSVSAVKNEGTGQWFTVIGTDLQRLNACVRQIEVAERERYRETDHIACPQRSLITRTSSRGSGEARIVAMPQFKVQQGPSRYYLQKWRTQVQQSVCDWCTHNSIRVQDDNGGACLKTNFLETTFFLQRFVFPFHRESWLRVRRTSGTMREGFLQLPFVLAGTEDDEDADDDTGPPAEVTEIKPERFRFLQGDDEAEEAEDESAAII